MRPRTISLRLPVIREDQASYPRGAARPQTRGECAGGQRPCPWVSCKFHLFLDVTRAGSLKLNFPAESVDGLVDNLEKMKETCVLDVAGGPDGTSDGDGVTLEDVGGLMNVTRERIRQMEEKFKRILKESLAVRAALGEEDGYWQKGAVPPMLPGEATRKLHRGAGRASAALLELPDEMFELGEDEEGDEADRASGVRTVGGAGEEPERDVG
jgi:hypothetical protein